MKAILKERFVQSIKDAIVKFYYHLPYFDYAMGRYTYMSAIKENLPSLLTEWLILRASTLVGVRNSVRDVRQCFSSRLNKLGIMIIDTKTKDKSIFIYLVTKAFKEEGIMESPKALQEYLDKQGIKITMTFLNQDSFKKLVKECHSNLPKLASIIGDYKIREADDFVNAL